MISIKCDLPATHTISELLEFQQTLKHRTSSAIDDLAESLHNDGLLLPFVAFKDSNGVCHLLDGHSRVLALRRLVLAREEHHDLLEQKFPVVFLPVDSLEDAKHTLLKINQRFGNITIKGLKEFLVDVPKLKVDTAKLHLGIHTTRNPNISILDRGIPDRHDFKVIRLRVHKDHLQEVRAALQTITAIEVLP